MRTSIVLRSLLLVMLFGFSVSLWADTIAKFCWKNSYGRGVGTPLSKCPANMEKNGLLCYRKCKPGYKGVGPVCWQTCPNGFRNDGAFCAKPKPYGRGAGFPWKFGDGVNDRGMRKRCEKRHGRGKCEKQGAIFYPKCKPGFHAVGCCVCSPNCVAGQKDIGVSCAKKSYGRGAGTPMRCASGLERNGALCYRKCKSRYTGVGPVCWAVPPRGWVNCGMGAAVDAKTCASAVTSQVTSVGNLALTVATLGSSSAATGATRSAQSGQKLAKLRKQFAQLQQLYKKNEKAINKVKTAAKRTGKVYSAYSAGKNTSILAMNADKAAPEDIARVSAEIAALLDPTGVASTVAAYTYPTCDKVKR